MKLEAGINRTVNVEWTSIRDLLRQSFSDYTDVGACPSMSLSDLMVSYKNSFENSNTDIITTNLPGCRNLMIRESIYLAHKAGALLRSYSQDVDNDNQTYAEISAYTASFFLARSISIILGCYMPTEDINSIYWLLDNRESKNSATTKLIKVGKGRPGHTHVWDLLKVLIARTRSTPFDREFITFITGLPTPDFSKVRHVLQYNNCAWIYEDLHLFQATDKEWIVPFNSNVYTNADPDDDSGHFSVVLSLMLLRNYDLILKDLSQGISTLEKERKFILENVEYSHNVLLTQSWLI